jgi:hypothetical protein
MNNKPLRKTFLALIVILSFLPHRVNGQEEKAADGPTEYHLLAPIPQLINDSGGDTTDTVAFIPGLFRLAIALATGLAVLMIIYGGFQYLSTDAWGEKNDAKGTIQNAVVGLLLTLSSYLIIATVNPKLVEFDLSIPIYDITTKLDRPNIPEPGTPGGGLTQAGAMSQLKGVVSYQGAPLLAGVQQQTIDEVIRLKNSCSTCVLVVNSATGGTHESGSCSHSNGWKIDLDDTPSLDAYVTGNYPAAGIRTSDKAKLYTAPSGAVYARESNHWDVTLPCN